MSRNRAVVFIAPRVILQTCLVSLLAACAPLHGLTPHLHGLTPRLVREAGYSEPELNPRPTRRLVVTGTRDSRIELSFRLRFETHGVDCGFSYEGGGARFPSERVDRQSSGSEEKFTIEFYLDKYLPGTCDWRPDRLVVELCASDISYKHCQEGDVGRVAQTGENGGDLQEFDLTCRRTVTVYAQTIKEPALNCGRGHLQRLVLSPNGARVHVTASAPPKLIDSASRDDILREMLNAGPTEQTRRFNAYLDKLALLEYFPPFAKKAGAEVRALVVVGPVGWFQTYHVMTFVSEGDKTRLNYLATPDGRIAYKGTRLLGNSEITTFLSDFQAMSGLPERGSSSAEIAKDLPDVYKAGDFRFNVMGADFSGPSHRVTIGYIRSLASWDPKRSMTGVRNPFEKLLDRLHDNLEVTYQHIE